MIGKNSLPLPIGSEQNFLEFQKAFTHSFGELVGKLDPFANGYEHLIIFTIYSELCYIVSHLDIMKSFLKIIINPQKIKGGFNDKTRSTSSV